MTSPASLSDINVVGRLLRTMSAGNPAAARFVGIQRGPDGSFDSGGVERAVHDGFRIVCWHPVG